VKSQFVSFEKAEEVVERVVKEIEPLAALPARQKVTKALKGMIQQELREILFYLVDSTDLTKIHKKEYFDSFKISVSNKGINIDFKPVSWLIGALEEGAPSRQMEDDLLKSNYKISKDGHKYKVIPLQTKQPDTGDFQLDTVFQAEQYGAEQFFKEVTLMIGEKSATIPLTTQQGSSADVRYVRSEPFLTRVKGRRRSRRIYITQNPKHNVDVVQRFTVFRTISDRPDAAKWRSHPGFPGLHLVSDLAAEYTQLVEKHIEDITLNLTMLRKAGGK
jgi:hypothetical protein